MIMIISLPPVSCQVVPQQFEIVQWTMSIYPYMTLDQYSPKLANFVSKLLSSVFALKIHFNRNNKRNSLFLGLEWRFQENLGDHLRRNIQDKSRVTYTRILK